MKVEPIRDVYIIQDIIQFLENKNERDAVLFMTGIYTGLRMSDILNLRIKDVIGKNILRIKQQKTGEYVEIPINIDLKRKYKKYCLGKEPHEYLIQNQRVQHNQAIKRDRAYKILNEVAEEYNLLRIGTHTLRKTCGYHLYKNNNNNIGLVMKILGQKDPSSTLNYIGINDVDILKGINSLRFK